MQANFGRLSRLEAVSNKGFTATGCRNLKGLGFYAAPARAADQDLTTAMRAVCQKNSATKNHANSCFHVVGVVLRTVV
jgi:hypothetical protein